MKEFDYDNSGNLDCDELISCILNFEEGDNK